MTPQEKMMIEGVAERLRAHTLTSKDPQAEELITQSIAAQPDALYRLTQSNILQEVALNEAKNKVATLEQQLAAYQNQSMLDRVRGAAPQVAQPVSSYQPSMFGSFMKTAAAMTTGVVAGNLISDALSGLFSSGEREGSWGAAGAAPQVVENITNNFMDPASAAGLTSDNANAFLANSDSLAQMSNTDDSNPFGLNQDINDPLSDADNTGMSIDNNDNNDSNDNNDNNDFGGFGTDDNDDNGGSFFDDDDDNNGFL